MYPVTAEEGDRHALHDRRDLVILLGLTVAQIEAADRHDTWLERRQLETAIEHGVERAEHQDHDHHGDCDD
jgi:hypothetical protein